LTQLSNIHTLTFLNPDASLYPDFIFNPDFDLEISLVKSRVIQHAFDIFANKNLRPCLESLMME